MKIEHDGEWLKFTDDEGFMESVVYFEPCSNGAHLGLDDFYCTKLNISELKLLAEFLTEYVEKCEGDNK